MEHPRNGKVHIAEEIFLKTSLNDYRSVVLKVGQFVGFHLFPLISKSDDKVNLLQIHLKSI